MSTSPHREWLLALADCVADAATRAGPAAIARAKAHGLDISYIEDGEFLIESADGVVRVLTPPSQNSSESVGGCPVGRQVEGGDRGLSTGRSALVALRQ